MGAFLNPRLYCEIAAVNRNARKILTFDGEVQINSGNADAIAAELMQILADSVLSAERQNAATERLAEQNRQVAARYRPVPKGAGRSQAEPLYQGVYSGPMGRVLPFPHPARPVFASRVGCMEPLPPVLIAGTPF